MDIEVRQLLLDVMDGNPGACVIVEKLLGCDAWYPLLCHLKRQGLVGTTLWRVVKDEYRHDWAQFAQIQLEQIT